MLTANKKKWFENVFSIYNRNLLKRRFSSLQVSGLKTFHNATKDKSVILYANHSSWWDGLVAFEISRLAELDAYVMMEEKQLKKLFLFRNLGAFSVNKDKFRDALKSIDYAAGLLDSDSAKSLWIFPQGAIFNSDERPIVFYNGLSKLIKKVKNVQTVPIAFRYEFHGEFKPRIFAKIGAIDTIENNCNFSSKSATQVFAQRLTSTLDQLKSEILDRDTNSYNKIF